MIFPKNQTVVVTDLSPSNGVQNKSVNILIMEEISTWWGTNKDDVYLALKGQDNVTEINLFISSPGGDLNEAMVIHDMLKGHKATVNAYLVGIVASSATVISCAADNVVMSEQSMYMIHNPSWIAWGTSDEMRKTADVLDQFGDIIINIYNKKTGLDAESLKSMMDIETWFTASQASQLGFVDSVVDTIELDFELEAVGNEQREDDDEMYMYLHNRNMTDVVSHYTSGITASMQRGVVPLKSVSNFIHPKNGHTMQFSLKNSFKGIVGFLTAQGFINKDKFEDAVSALNDAPDFQAEIPDEVIQNAIADQLNADTIVNVVQGSDEARTSVLAALGLDKIDQRLQNLTNEIAELKKPGSGKSPENNGDPVVTADPDPVSEGDKPVWNRQHLKMMLGGFDSNNVTADIVKASTGYTPDEIRALLQADTGAK